jgi:type VI secretion system protein ImpH
MAATRWRTDPPVDQVLFEQGYEFTFFQAIRLLRRLFPDRRLIGTDARPESELVRIGAWLSMNFPASVVDQVQYSPDRPEQQPCMTVTFMGLTGPQGILPLHYTEWLIDLKAGKDTVLADFFDLFNHRLISLFYRAWAKHNPPVIYESALLDQRGVKVPQPDSFTRSLFDFIGLGTDGIRGQMKVKDESLVFYAGLIAQRPHSASALRAILRNYFAVEVQIEQFHGSWYEIEKPDRSYLAPNFERNQLGVGAFLGDKVWNQQDRFRIRIGPVSRARFHDFLPTGPAMAKLVEITRFMVGQALTFDVQVVIEKEQVPVCRLQEKGDTAPRLGWISWLKTETSHFADNPGEAVFARVG